MAWLKFSAAIAVLSLLAPIAMAQVVPDATRPMANPPKTVDGYPDFEGVWSNASVTSLERPGDVSKLVLSAEEAAKYEHGSRWVANDRNQSAEHVDVNSAPASGKDANLNLLGYNSFWLDPGYHLAMVKGEFRTSWIIEPANGKLPRKPRPPRTAKATDYGGFDGPEGRPTRERCIVYGQKAGPVMENTLYNNNYQFIQTKDAVVMSTEMIHDVRIIPIFANRDVAVTKHRPKEIAPWFGDSVGWYEGNTLVVETTNAKPESAPLISPSGRVTERFSRWSDRQILYEFQVDDPQLYTQTWKGEMSLNRLDQPIYEYACAEGNYALPDILSGARHQEKMGINPSSITGGE